LKLLGLLLVLVLGGCADHLAPDACAVDPVGPCRTPPATRCDGNVRVIYHAAGRCSEDAGGAAVCDYPIASQVDCTALGQVCMDAACKTPEVIPCAGVTCFTPPQPDCDGNTSRVYASSGSCDASDGECHYQVSASLDCTPSSKVCVNGSCEDPSVTPCDPEPCDTPPQGSCNGNVPVVPAASGECAVIASAASCTYVTSNASPCGDATPECRNGRCASGVGTPLQPGVLVISEIMKHPAIESGVNAQADWFELHNPTTLSLELDGCEVAGETIPNVDLFVPAGGDLVIGASHDPKVSGGFDPDYVIDTLSLDSASGTLAIVCGGTTIDSVSWASGWPMAAGRAMSLDPQASDATQNDLIASWCDAPTPYGNHTNTGSPRRGNPACE